MTISALQTYYERGHATEAVLRTIGASFMEGVFAMNLHGQPGLVIRGTGSALPSRIIDNRAFEQILDTSDEWIRQRTGIRCRRFAAPHETSATLAIDASRRALDMAGVDASEIDLVVCGTVTPDRMTPPNAAVVQAALGCRIVPAFDLSAACSGFLYALGVAQRFIHGGDTRCALVIGAEVLSRVMDYQDRASCILFGDGAGAVVITPSPVGNRGILQLSLAADGSCGDLIQVPALAGGHGLSSKSARSLPHIAIRGRETFRFAVRTMISTIQEAVTECGLNLGDITAIVPHQVNLRVFEAVACELAIPLDKMVMNIDRLGNTSAASVPVALDEAVRSGRIAEGDVVVLVAFGGGLTWSAAVIRW
jgi:3-oxoacyl-[acyl-carrier-protein] synthase-3